MPFSSCPWSSLRRSRSERALLAAGALVLLAPSPARGAVVQGEPPVVAPPAPAAVAPVAPAAVTPAAPTAVTPVAPVVAPLAPTSVTPGAPPVEGPIAPPVAPAPSAVKPPSPWWTGSLLASPGHIIPVGNALVEPYLIYAQPLSPEPTRSLSTFIVAEAGLTRVLDIQVAVEGVYQMQGAVSSAELGGTSARLAFQLLEDEADTAIPSVMFTVQESFPTGRYEHLDPALKGTDASGGGAYSTTIGLNAQKVFWPSAGMPLRLRLNLAASAPIGVPLAGPSVYGGSAQTQGTLFPGKGVRALVAGELHLTRSWVVALDVGYAHVGENTFVATTPVVTQPGQPAEQLGSPSRDSITVAPAVEYNFNGGIGLLGGLSIAGGRNVTTTLSPMIALNMVY